MGSMIVLAPPVFLRGAENAISMCLAQLALILPVLVINRRFFVSGCIVILLGIACGASEMVAFFAGRTSKGTLCIEAFFCLTVGIYAITRVASFVKDSEVMTEAEVDEETVASEISE